MVRNWDESGRLVGRLSWPRAVRKSYDTDCIRSDFPNDPRFIRMNVRSSVRISVRVRPTIVRVASDLDWDGDVEEREQGTLRMRFAAASVPTSGGRSTRPVRSRYFLLDCVSSPLVCLSPLRPLTRTYPDAPRRYPAISRTVIVRYRPRNLAIGDTFLVHASDLDQPSVGDVFGALVEVGKIAVLETGIAPMLRTPSSFRYRYTGELPEKPKLIPYTTQTDP